jgi:DNA-nicking Smr family endonuclease
MAAYSCKNGVVTVDIHQMYAPDAKRYLERLLKSLGDEVVSVEIIHGYNSGSALQRTVRQEVRSKRIKRRCVSLNPGVTIYYLK